MEHIIDLLIMPPHCSHVLQPLDVGVFPAFKRYCTGYRGTVVILGGHAQWAGLHELQGLGEEYYSRHRHMP
jgi:hypothetical protein